MSPPALTDAELRTAITLLRTGLGSDEAGVRIGRTGRAIRKRLAAWGLRASDLHPSATLPRELAKQERRRRLALVRAERDWDRARRDGARAHAVHADTKRRDVHLQLTPAAVAALHTAADQQQCSLSSLVADALYEQGLIPEP